MLDLVRGDAALESQHVVGGVLADDMHRPQAALVDLLHVPVGLGDDGLSLRLSGLEQLHYPQQTANGLFQHFEHLLDGLDFSPLATALVEAQDTGLDVPVNEAQRLLLLLLHFGHTRQILAGDAAGVEGAHGELRARLANGLGGDDANRRAHLNQTASRQVLPVATGADASAQFAGVGCADADGLDAQRLGALGVGFFDERSRLGDDFTRFGIDDVLQGAAAADAFLQPL